MSRLRRFVARPWSVALGMIATICLFGPGASPALAIRYGAIEVVVEPQPAAEGGYLEMRPGGYIEHRVVVRNHSKTVDHKIRLVQPAEKRSHYLDYLARNSRTVQVAHGSSLVVSLFEPGLPVTDESMVVEIDGSRQEGLVALSSPLSRGYGYPRGIRQSLLVLASRGIPQDLKDEVRNAHANEVGFCRSELAVSDWSANWLGYAGYDVLLMTEQEAASLPTEVLLALRRYVETGGILLVQGSSPDVDAMIPDALRDSDADAEGAFHVGFGLARPCPATTPWPSEFWTARSKDRGIPQDRDVQIATDIDVPVRGILLVVILFAVGIGPVNVWILSRRRKRMWLWWNVPAVSLATCLAVFAYALSSEGVSSRGRTALITLLDENTHRATTLGYASYYCPLTPDGLHFSYDTEVEQLHSSAASGMRFNAGRPKTVDWTNDQHLDSGWILARVPACFAIRKSETRRERLAIHKSADGKLSVVNGLGVEIDSLIYVDENGVAGYASAVPVGEQRALEPRQSGGKKPPEEPESLRIVFDQPWNASLRELRASPEKFVKPGCYVAVIKKNPFLEDPLVTAPQNGSIGVIYGIGARSGNGR